MSSLPRVAAWLALSVSSAAWLTACGPEQRAARAPLPDGLFHGIVSDQAVLVAPADRWENDVCGRESWSFRLQADLVVSVQRSMTGVGDFALVLEPASRDVAEQVSVTWRGKPIRTSSAEADRVRFGLPTADLARGIHLLRVHLPPSLENPSATACFRRVAHVWGGDEVALVASRRSRWRILADIATLGVTRTGHVQRSGLLFVGPGRRDFGAVSFEHAASLELDLRNRSRAEATFTVTVDGVGTSQVVDSYGNGRIRVPVAAGERQLALQVEGRPGGWFRWSSRVLFEEDPVPEGEPGSTPVVIVTLDTTRRDVLPLYGDRVTPMPNLDALAGEATLYRRAYAAAPWTLPSHASIFTGRHPSQHGAGVTEVRLPIESLTLAELYRRAGYLTAGFAGGPMVHSRFGVAQGFDTYVDPVGWQSSGPDVLDALESFLDEHTGERRLFLFVNLFEPHALYEAPEPHRGDLELASLEVAVRDEPGMADLIAKVDGAWQQIVYGQQTLSPAGLRYLRAAYRAELAYTDALLGRLIDLLKSHGLYDRSLLVVTSDHGELLGENGHYSHGVRLDPELLEIPLLVRQPGQASPEIDDGIVSHVDLFEILARPLGLHPAILESAAELEKRGEELVLSEEHASLSHPLIEHGRIALHLYALQGRDRRAVVWNGGAQCQQADDEGWVDVDCWETWPTLLAEAVALAGRDVAEFGSAPTSEVLTEEERERLEALGYL